MPTKTSRKKKQARTARSEDAVAIETLPDHVRALVNRLVSENAALAAENGALTDANGALAAENTRLNEQLAHLLRRRYGPQSEKMDAAQLELFSKQIEELLAQRDDGVEDPANVLHASSEKGRKKPSGRRRLPEHLPRIMRHHTLDADDLPCPTCGEERIEIGTKRSEQIEYVPAKIAVIEHVAHTYACRACAGEVETASRPTDAIGKCLAAPSLLAHVIVSKFDDHLPLYRQEEILKRNGIEINRSTMCNWMLGCAEALEPLYKLMHTRIMRSRVIQTDGTSLPLIERGRGSTRNAGFWVYRGDDRARYVLYDFTRTQDRAGPERWLKGYSGTLQADAATLYDSFFDEKRFGTRVVEAGCWAHARRYFEKAKMQHPAESMTALAWIAKLYEIEKQTKSMSRQRRRKVRRNHARRIVHGFDGWLRTIEPSALPKSALGKAVRYVRRHWDALNRYIDNGRLEIDNNASERAIRPMTVGRKNWLFAGSLKGGRATAVLFSMIESAKRVGVPVEAWLEDVLARIADTPAHELAELLPDHWSLVRGNPAVRQQRAATRRRREHDIAGAIVA